MCLASPTHAHPKHTYLGQHECMIKWTSPTTKPLKIARKPWPLPPYSITPSPEFPSVLLSMPQMLPSVPSYSSIMVISSNPLLFFPRLYHPTSYNITLLAGNSLQHTPQLSTFVCTWRQRNSTSRRTSSLSLSPFTHRTNPQSPCKEQHTDYISQFTTDVHHIRGTDNQAINNLSRVTVSAMTLVNSAVDYHLVSREQRQDTSMIPLIKGQTSLGLERVQILHSHDYLLCDVSLDYPRLYIPPSLRW